ncbi:MAG: DUF4349 domain-containing protein [Acidimicrobiia bacterium]
MGPFEKIRTSGFARLALLVMLVSMVVAACSHETDAILAAVDGDELDYLEGEEILDQAAPEGEGAYKTVVQDGRVVFESTAPSNVDAKIIKDGSVDIRIEPGTFGVSAGQIRAIATDLGGYIASGETRIEQYDDARYAVGWYTMRIPTDRFDDAVSRVEQLGERVSAQLSSQDVTEEYVDLEGRLSYWRDQEAFYQRLMAEATTIEELVTVQTRMQDVLLNIEQIEGRLRFLDSRTAYATLTVGVTEVPIDGPVPIPEPSDPNPIQEAFSQAGEVLLATVGFIIVASAVAIPIGILVLFAYGVVRLLMRALRRERPAQS